MQKQLAKLCLLLLFIGNYFFSGATHIVGGVMNYRYLGNDRYEISLFVYRDCVYGIPPLDDPARIRVWDGVSETVYGFSKPFDDTLPIVQPDPCARIDSGAICVNWTRYLDTLILPPNDLGYTIYYQRCCRNNTIQNLTYNSRGAGAMDWGATYTINIPPSVVNAHVQNTSPVFVNYPPVYICVNKPLIYDNRAIDTDGDSLVYRLCTPYSGAYPSDPLNQFTLEAPPFENVIWDVGYSESNMLGGVPLSINPTTGLLTGTPNTLGQFVVGICVDEYRNGALLTKTIRDFQFNVIDCNLQIISSFFAPDIQCNSFTVNFQNQSSGATSYKWYFGDGDSSTALNPSHTYAQTGIYTVRLVAVNSITNSCIADYSRTISIQYKKIEADFTTQVSACLQRGDVIKFIDRSTDSFNVASWHWTFSNGDSSNVQNPVLFYNGTDTSVTATLLVTSTNGCTSAITKTIRLFKKPSYTITPIVTKCSNVQTAQLSLVMTGNNTFSWTPTTGLSNPNTQNPTTSTNTNITYYVTIKSVLANGDTCVQYDSVQVKTINTVQINASDTTRVCNDSVRLSVPVSAGQTVVWSTSNIFVPVLGTTGNISIAQTIPSQKYYVKITAQGCEAIDSIVALYSKTIPQISLADNILQCSNQISLTATVDFYDQILWSTSSAFNPVLSTTNPLITAQIPKTVKYYIKANYQTCSNTDSITITVQDTLPSIVLADTMNVCGGIVRITSVVRKFTSLIWSTDTAFTTIIGTTQNINVSQNVPRQVYYIKAFYRDCFITDSIVVNYNPNQISIALDDSAFFCSNQVTLSANVSNANTITWSTSPTFTPVLSNQPVFTAVQTIPVQSYYIKAAFDFCSKTDRIQVRIPENATSINLDDTIFVCKDSVRVFAHVTNYDSLVWATNINFIPVISRDTNLVFAQSEPQKTYYIKTFNDGCESVDSVVVFYNDTIPTVSLYNKTGACIGVDKNNIVKLEATVDFYTSFIWAKDRNFDSVISTTNLAFQIQQLDTSKWYYFKAKYNFCETIDSIRINHFIIAFSNTSEICKGDKASISITITGLSDIFVFLWKTKDSTIARGYDITQIQYYPNETQYVYVTAYNRFGCEIINDSLLITVHPLPIIDASVDKPLINIGEQVQLTATQSQNYTYNWIPIDLVSNASIFNPTSSPTQTTLYTVLVTDRNNCKAQDTVSVRVENTVCDNTSIFIPSAFSPNNDGTNDVFKVRSAPLKSYHLLIYDRWGNKVFESNDATLGWNGTYKNQPATLDIYGYYFEGECLQGEKIIHKGNVTLVK
ncbi:MAG: gliding motility-associated C-terminal domain-containing protein [Chitinophagales bacterium]